MEQTNIFDFIEESTEQENTVEATDEALVLAEPKFTENQIVTIVNPYEEDDEDYHHLKELDGVEVRIVSVRQTYKMKTIYYEVETIGGINPKLKYFYENELK